MKICHGATLAAILSLCLLSANSEAQDQKSQGAVARLGNWLTSDLAEATTRFTSAAQSDVELAYAGTSHAFQHWLTKQQFLDFLLACGLNQSTDVKWLKRKVTAALGGDSVGEVEGTFVDKNGATQPIKLVFVKESGLWRVQGIDIPEPGGLAGGLLRSEESLVRLTNASMNAFRQSVNANSMAPLFDYVALQWRDKRSVQEFDKAFNGFLNKGIVLPDFSTLGPVFRETPALDKNGRLVARGSYLQGEKQFYGFSHEYAFEGIGWKLVTINIEADGTGKRADEVRPKVPPQDVYVRLVKSAMEDFVASAMASDMGRLHKRMSVQAKSQLSVGTLNQSFAAFFKQQVELGLVANMAPVVDTPSVSPAGVLVVIGHYPTTPRTVAFKLRYFKEGLSESAEGWKLSGISIVIDPDAAQKIRS